MTIWSHLSPGRSHSDEQSDPRAVLLKIRALNLSLSVDGALNGADIVTVSTVQAVHGGKSQTSNRSTCVLASCNSLISEEYGTDQIKYDFTGLNEVKPAMVEEATKNASRYVWGLVSCSSLLMNIPESLAFVSWSG